MPGDLEDDRVTVTVAARKIGAGERTLFRAVADGQIPSAKRGGVTVVSLADAERWKARRASRKGLAPTPEPAAAPAPQPAIPAIPTAAAAMAAAGRAAAPIGTTSLVLDGDLASLLFAAYDRGETPTELVQRHHVAPAVALLAMRQYEELREMSGGEDRLESGLSQLRAEDAQLRRDFEALVTASDELRVMLESLASRARAAGSHQ